MAFVLSFSLLVSVFARLPFSNLNSYVLTKLSVILTCTNGKWSIQTLPRKVSVALMKTSPFVEMSPGWGLPHSTSVGRIKSPIILWKTLDAAWRSWSKNALQDTALLSHVILLLEPRGFISPRKASHLCVSLLIWNVSTPPLAWQSALREGWANNYEKGL